MEEHYIYNEDYYKVYQNLDDLIQNINAIRLIDEIDTNPDNTIDDIISKLSEMSIEEDNKTVIWQLFGVNTPSNIDWKNNKLRVNSQIEKILVNYYHYDWFHKMQVSKNFKFIRQSYLGLYNTNKNAWFPQNVLDNNLIIIAPIMTLKKLVIVGLFIVGKKQLSLSTKIKKSYLSLSDIGSDPEEKADTLESTLDQQLNLSNSPKRKKKVNIVSGCIDNQLKCRSHAIKYKFLSNISTNRTNIVDLQIDENNIFLPVEINLFDFWNKFHKYFPNVTISRKRLKFVDFKNRKKKKI
jgi:hypothetical protein